MMRASDVKGDALERHIATPAWRPLLSLESVDGPLYKSMLADFHVMMKLLPPPAKLAEIAKHRVDELVSRVERAGSWEAAGAGAAAEASTTTTTRKTATRKTVAAAKEAAAAAAAAEAVAAAAAAAAASAKVVTAETLADGDGGVVVGPGGYRPCSPRHMMPFNSRHKVPNACRGWGAKYLLLLATA